MTDEDIEKRFSKLEGDMSNFKGRISSVEKDIKALDQRVDLLDEKMIAILSTTAEIKQLLTTNTKDTVSAKRNSFGWGFLSVFVSIATKILEYLFIF